MERENVLEEKLKWWQEPELNRRHKDFQFCLIRTFCTVENMD